MAAHPGLKLTMKPFKFTQAWDTYWYFAQERHDLYLARLSGQTPPWTTDPILSAYRFTNTYRAADKVSQYLIQRVIRPARKSRCAPEELLYRIILFKLFNKIETWELVAPTVVNFAGKDRDKRILKLFNHAVSQGTRLYSAAYIMAMGAKGYTKKHESHLALLDLMMKDDLAGKLTATPTMAQGYDLFLSYPGIGTFLAYQLATDVNYSELTAWREDEFVKAGPGALEGIAKVFKNDRGKSPEYLIQYTMEQQEQMLSSFSGLFGRPLQLIDCQNLYCEVAKYTRVSLPELTKEGGRSKIKQRYSPTIQRAESMPKPRFPKDWKLQKAVDLWWGNRSSLQGKGVRLAPIL